VKIAHWFRKSNKVLNTSIFYADEVRTLASRSQQSTQEIQSVIEKLQAQAAEAVQVMEHSKAQTKISVEHAQEAGKSLDVISSSVSDISDMNIHIATAAEEQSAVTEEINSNIVNISQVAETSSEGAAQISSATNELNILALELQSLVARFKL